MPGTGHEASPAVPQPAQAAGTGGAEAVYRLGEALGVARDRMDAYLDWAWGVGWCRNPQGIQRVLADLSRFQGNPDGLHAHIAAEIGAPA